MNLEALKAMLTAATPGPWKLDYHQLVSTIVDPLGITGNGVVMNMPGINEPSDTDINLIIALRNLAPELLAVVEAAQGHIDGLIQGDMESSSKQLRGMVESLDALTAKLGAMK